MLINFTSFISSNNYCTINWHFLDSMFTADLLKVQAPADSPASQPPPLVTPTHVTLFVCGSFLTIVSASAAGSSGWVAPRCQAYWNVTQLRRFGILDERFCCEVEENGGIEHCFLDSCSWWFFSHSFGEICNDICKPLFDNFIFNLVVYIRLYMVDMPQPLR